MTVMENDEKVMLSFLLNAGHVRSQGSFLLQGSLLGVVLRPPQDLIAGG